MSENKQSKEDKEDKIDGFSFVTVMFNSRITDKEKKELEELITKWGDGKNYEWCVDVKKILG